MVLVRSFNGGVQASCRFFAKKLLRHKYTRWGGVYFLADPFCIYVRKNNATKSDLYVVCKNDHFVGLRKSLLSNPPPSLCFFFFTRFICFCIFPPLLPCLYLSISLCPLLHIRER
eukprot:GEMP01105070.1.p2 GENE.GEMP01105070.1~~GEMP01105070.1.p2  ORF type:complete len:115 (-),score=1.92 GEMP01105070.1:113-457(-)